MSMSALESMMPEPRTAETNGIRMTFWEAGPRQGTPVVLCHGFPELAFSWRHQIKALGEAGRRVIAPDQRGFGLTSRPERVEDYDMAHLCADLVGLLDHLGVEKAVFCGHDWGGAVVWQMPIRHPDRVAGVIGVNTPHRARPPADPIAIYRQRLGEDMYMVQFQTPGLADAILARDVARTMSFFLRRPPPGQSEAGPGLAGGGSSFPLVKMLEAYDPALDPRQPFLTDEEMAVFVASFTRTGFTGGINWYRNITRNWEISAGQDERIGVPALMVLAELDAVLPPSLADGMEALIPDLEKVLIKGSGHWTQQEKPAETSAAILDWLERRAA
jgi:pimeloyl-ACP methyl ester carboxylesterase